LVEYNAALCRRGEIDVWLSEDMISLWYEKNRVYDGAGTPKRFSDFSIITCHEIRQVYRLPLRQTQGFINSIFRLMNIPLVYPNFSCLTKRFGRGEWHQEKYVLSNKASWRKLHVAVNQSNYFEACVLTGRFSHDEDQV